LTRAGLCGSARYGVPPFGGGVLNRLKPGLHTRTPERNARIPRSGVKASIHVQLLEMQRLFQGLNQRHQRLSAVIRSRGIGIQAR
jgi:hypothetical protein